MMNRTFSAALWVSCLLAPAAMAAPLSASQIVEKNVAARGGLQAWRGLDSISMSGEMDAGGQQDTLLPFVLSLKRGHKSRLEIRFQGQSAVQAYDGSQGWKYRPYLNRDDIEPYTAAEAKLAADAAELDGPLVDYAKKGTQVELQGTEKVEGKNTYKLKLTLKDGKQFHLWVDAASFLELKIDGEPRKLDNKLHQVAVFYRDYKTVGSLKLPYSMETVVSGVKQTHKMSIHTVTLNPPLADALFVKPQNAAALKASAAP